jgi:hypothetical protein
LETPTYEVLSTTELYELRRYGGYSVCTTALTPNVTVSTDVIITEPLTTSLGFRKLANYFFGQNTLDGLSSTISMTVPVILDSKAISFVLPRQYNAMTAPIPQSNFIELRDIPAVDVAVLEFTGVVTGGEVLRQKALLEDALLSQNISYDPTTFQVFKYNPPYALPWVRKNEITCQVMLAGAQEGGEDDRSATEDHSKFFAAPEAGD